MNLFGWCFSLIWSWEGTRVRNPWQLMWNLKKVPLKNILFIFQADGQSRFHISLDVDVPLDVSRKTGTKKPPRWGPSWEQREHVGPLPHGRPVWIYLSDLFCKICKTETCFCLARSLSLSLARYVWQYSVRASTKLLPAFFFEQEGGPNHIF